MLDKRLKKGEQKNISKLIELLKSFEKGKDEQKKGKED